MLIPIPLEDTRFSRLLFALTKFKKNRHRAGYQLLSYILMTIFSAHAMAFSCHITIVKDNCWTDYNLTVSVTDASNGNELVKILVPKGESWGRKTFTCDKGQTLAMSAQFDPVFWAEDANKNFLGQRYWKLPDQIENGVSGWNVTVCYPKWFANVPTPPKSTSHCRCNTDNLPALPPAQINN